MHKSLLIYCILVPFLFGCSPNKAITNPHDRNDALHRQVSRIDRKFNSNFPGSEVHVYYDEYGEIAVAALVNVLTPVSHCSPLSSKSFYNLPTIWNNKDPYLDQLSGEIGEYLLYRMDASAVDHIIVRIEKDKEGKIYTSIYRISHEKKHEMGVSTFIDLAQSHDDDYYYLNLEKTMISQCCLVAN
jgi:hypothetical protein